MGTRALVRLAASVVILAGASSASAQDLPAGPIRAFGETLTLGGEVVATAGRSDSTAFFNYTDYGHNALRMMRLALAAEWRPTDRLAFIGQLRVEDFSRLTLHAAYVRFRPWTGRRFDIQIGRIPPTFGAFGRRAYSTSDGLIGYPLAYQYLTSLRPDAAPATIDDLIAMRGRGWLSTFPVGNRQPAPGIPLISVFQWDTGIQAHWASDRMTMTGAITSGTLSTPRVDDNNSGKQVSARVTVRPAFGLVLGASAARGAWLSRDVVNELPAAHRRESYAQTAIGTDVEYSRDHWIVRSEAIWSRWRVPTPRTSDRPSVNLDAFGAFVEGRYRLTPRISVSARLDKLMFSSIRGTTPGAAATPWDAPVRRVELGAGYLLQRNLTARIVLQRNVRDGGRVSRRTFVSGQLAFWF